MTDGGVRTSAARGHEAVELSALDRRKFDFMLDEVPNFARRVLGNMADRIWGDQQGGVTARAMRRCPDGIEPVIARLCGVHFLACRTLGPDRHRRDKAIFWARWR
jgi:CRP-like cAMP-binding protein